MGSDNYRHEANLRSQIVALGLQLTDVSANKGLELIDCFIQQVLLAKAEGFSGADQVHFSVNQLLGPGVHIASKATVIDSLLRLAALGYLEVIADKKSKEDLFKLTEQRRILLGNERFQADHLWVSAFHELFSQERNIPLDKYKEPIWDTLLSLMDNYTSEFVDSFLENKAVGIGVESIDQTCRAAARVFLGINADILIGLITKIIKSKLPATTQLKYVLMQTQFCIKLLGYNVYHSKEMIDLHNNLEFYLDTNLLVNYLLPTMRHFVEADALVRAAHTLKIKLIVTSITLEELYAFRENALDLIAQYSAIIPERVLADEEINGDLLAAYRQAAVSPEEFLAPLRQAETALNLAGMELLSDPWFATAKDSPEIVQVASEVRNRAIRLDAQGNPRKTKGGRLIYRKWEKPIVRDALNLSWVFAESEKRGGGTSVMFITLDRSIVGIDIKGKRGLTRVPVLTLDRALQWLSPYALPLRRDIAAQHFSASLSYQFFPRRLFFEIDDFKLFITIQRTLDSFTVDEVKIILNQNFHAITKYNLDDPKELEQYKIEMRSFVDNRLWMKLYEADKAKRRAVARTKRRFQQHLDDKDEEIRRYLDTVKMTQAAYDNAIERMTMGRVWNYTILYIMVIVILGIMIVVQHMKLNPDSSILDVIDKGSGLALLVFGSGGLLFWVVALSMGIRRKEFWFNALVRERVRLEQMKSKSRKK